MVNFRSITSTSIKSINDWLDFDFGTATIDINADIASNENTVHLFWGVHEVSY